MSLDAKLQSAVKKMFKGPMLSLVKEYSIKRTARNQTDFDPSTGQYRANQITDKIKGIIVGVEKSISKEYGAQPQEKSLICIKHDINKMKFEPSIGDIILLGSQDHRIVDLKVDPAEVTITYGLKSSK